MCRFRNDAQNMCSLLHAVRRHRKTNDCFLSGRGRRIANKRRFKSERKVETHVGLFDTKSLSKQMQ